MNMNLSRKQPDSVLTIKAVRSVIIEVCYEQDTPTEYREVCRQVSYLCGDWRSTVRFQQRFADYNKRTEGWLLPVVMEHLQARKGDLEVSTEYIQEFLSKEVN